MRRLIILLTAILSAAGLVLAALYIYVKGRAQGLDPDSGSAAEYDRHYLFISSDRSQMMQDIFYEMSEKCRSDGAYLEWCGSGAEQEYDASECIDISLAMDADGIILYPDGTTSLSDAVSSAADTGVPVVTFLRDLPDSGRICYVGVSSYQMGELYGEWLLSLMEKGTNEVCLLDDAGDTGSGTQLLYSQMIQAVRNGAPDDEDMKLVMESVDSTEDFDAEEVIRGILLADDSPDILICRDSVQTECAVQAIIDYNLVGSVRVMGYYTTDETLSALRQEIIPVTMTVDIGTLGDDCLQALDEYLQTGRTSSYYNISMDSLTAVNLDAYGEGDSRDAEGGAGDE